MLLVCTDVPFCAENPFCAEKAIFLFLIVNHHHHLCGKCSRDVALRDTLFFFKLGTAEVPCI